MDKKVGLLGYLSQVFMIYGITIMLLNVFCIIFGNKAKSVSSIFIFGNEALAISTMIEFFIAIALIIVMRFIFMTDFFIKKMPLFARVIMLFFSVLIIIIGFVLLFEWFPVKETGAWIMFALCFVLSCGISTIISIVSEKRENKKLEDALRRYKEEQ